MCTDTLSGSGNNFAFPDNFSRRFSFMSSMNLCILLKKVIQIVAHSDFTTITLFLNTAALKKIVNTLEITSIEQLFVTKLHRI